MVDSNNIYHIGFFSKENIDKEIKVKEIKFIKKVLIIFCIIFVLLVIVNTIKIANFNSLKNEAVITNDIRERNLTNIFSEEAKNMGYDVCDEGYVKGNKYYFLSKSGIAFKNLNSLKFSAPDKNGEIHLENSDIIF